MTRRYLNSFFLVTIFFSLFFGLVSCNKDTDSAIGLNIIPGSDKINLYCDTIGVRIFTEKTDKILVDDKILAPVGSYIDPVFGFSKASFASQFKLPVSNVNFSNVQTVDKIALHLKLYSCYGDSLSPQTVKIYRLNTDLDVSETYYSDYQINVAEQEFLTESTLLFNHSDSARIIKIELPIELANDFISSSNTGHFVNDTIFRKFFKGLYITSESVSSGGGIFSFAMMDSNTKIVMTYNDTAEFSFTVDSKVAIVKMFEHDYSSASPELIATLGNPDGLFEYSYIQGLGGMRVKMDFPELARYIEADNISINRARLVLNLKMESQGNEYAPPPKLTIMRKSTSSDEMDYITDQLENSTVFDGAYDETSQTYNFNISLNVQEIVSGYIEDSEIFIMPQSGRNQATPHRSVIYANTGDDLSPRLEIYYSQY
ncbi:MAG: DUF4270 domain-containing protein [Bacteroidales bacterium]|jgi:hypothetical protein|nr:DUF4270 domain-containing protein [Bacteroidales bacterium]